MNVDINEINNVLKNDGLLSKHFPNYNERESQIKLACEILNSYNDGTNLVAEAPTGIGKSIAGLIPAVLYSIKNNNHKTLITTSTKALQMQYYDKDLPFLRKVFNDRFSYAMLKGRGNYVCLRRYNEFYNENILKGTVENYDTVKHYEMIRPFIESTTTGDMDELTFDITSELRSEIGSNADECDGKKCEYKDSCFYRRAKANAKQADLLLVNTDLFCTDLVVKHQHFGQVLPNYQTVIIDEAHELENIFSKYVGFKLSENAFKRTVGFMMKYVNRLLKEFCKDDVSREDVSNSIKDMDDNAVKLMKAVRSFFDNFVFDIKDNSETIKIDNTDFDYVTILAGKKLVGAVENMKSRIADADLYSTDDVILDMYDKVHSQFDSLLERLNRIMKLAEGPDEDYVYWVSYTTKGYNPIIECCPIDISPMLNNWLFTRKNKIEYERMNKSFMDDDEKTSLPIKNVVLMSATLTTNKSFYFITSRLGIDDYDTVLLPHAFDYKHNALLYVPKGLVEPNIAKNSDTFTLQLANNIIELSNITEGKMLCLFTSYNEMSKTYDIVSRQLGGKYRIFNQRQYPKNELVKMFKNDTNSMLFATASFWQGIDFQGETLSALVIDRIPFPVPSEPVIEARINKIKKHGGDWFNTYYIPMATMDMCQGVGRLIRTTSDRGIVMICDVRVITKNYGYKFINSFPPMLHTRKIEKVKFFWEICIKKNNNLKKRNKL